MESFLLFVVLVVLIIRWGILSRRYHGMEERIEMLVRSKIDPIEITLLIKRITQLENTVSELRRHHTIDAAVRVAVEADPIVEPALLVVELAREPAPPEPLLQPVMAPESPQPEPEPVAAPEP